MAIYTELSLGGLQDLAKRTGIKPAKALQGLAAGSVNTNYFVDLVDDTRLFLRIYEEQASEGALEEWRLLKFLESRSIPVPRRVAPHEGVVLHQGKPIAFFEEVAGVELCYQSTSEAHLRAMGAFLGRLHRETQDYPDAKAGRFEVDDLLVRLERVAAEGLADSELQRDHKRMTAALRDFGDTVFPESRCIIHGDLFRDNVRFQGTEILAVLDWESASWGSPIFDLCVLLLAWCFGGDFDEDRMRAIVASYQRERPLAFDEQRAMHGVARLVALRFATTRITDFYMRRASMAPSAYRDYRRFLARLDWLDRVGEPGFRRALGLS